MPRHKLRNLVMALTALLCLGFTGVVAYILITVPESVQAEIGGPFALEDSAGRVVTSDDFLGRYLLMYFGYTYCPDVCPTRLQEMSLALDDLEVREPEFAAEVIPVFVSVDPKRDTAAVLKSYSAHFHPRFEALRGSEAEVFDLVRAYQGYVRYVPGKDGEDYLVDHPAYVYLVGPDGKYLTHFTTFQGREDMVERLLRLGTERRG